MFDISSPQAKGIHGDSAGRQVFASQDVKHAGKQATRIDNFCNNEKTEVRHEAYRQMFLRCR
jgi:hypothetical protein